MYFYTLTYSDYEEFAKKIYISDIEYSQSDFKNIILQAYERRCYEIIDETPDALCYPNVLFAIDSVILDKKFDAIMKDFGFIRSRPVSTASIDFKKDNQFDLINNLIIDDNCKEDCWRLKDEHGNIDTEDMLYCKRNCIITRRNNEND